MSQTNRLSAADVVALSGMSRMLAFMRETLSGEVETRMRKVSRGRVLKGNLALNQLATFDRYFYYSQMGPEFWVGGGFSLGQDALDDYPWLSVILEVGPNQPGRDEIISAMRSFAAGSSRCEPYDLDNPAAWSGLDWAIDLRELLTAEDHMAAARVHLLKSLDDVARMQEKYPRLPWERDV
jgi:hypothetical protein